MAETCVTSDPVDPVRSSKRQVSDLFDHESSSSELDIFNGSGSEQSVVDRSRKFDKNMLENLPLCKCAKTCPTDYFELIQYK